MTGTCRDCAHWQLPKRKRIQPYEWFKCAVLSDATIHVRPAHSIGCHECDPYGMDTLTLETAPTFGCNQWRERDRSHARGRQET